MVFYLRLFFVFCFALTTCRSFAQKSKHLGINVILEASTEVFKPSFGINYEQRFTKRSGIEADILYRNYTQNWQVTFENDHGINSALIRFKESHISIPALYKFYTRVVDFAAGPSFEFYMGWTQKSSNPTINMTGHSGMNPFNIGLLTKVSKNVKLNDQFYLEPEVRFNPILTNDRHYIGIGIAGKYKL